MNTPKVGIFTQSTGGEHLSHCLESIQLNTDFDKFESVEVLFVIDPLFGTEHEINTQLTWAVNTFPWFGYIMLDGIRGAIPHRGLQGTVLNDLYYRLWNNGCNRFFHINDDVSMTKWWLSAAESTLADHGGECTVIPYDGISCQNQPVGIFSNFHYFDIGYVERYCPEMTMNNHHTMRMPYYQGNQCYWQDTEWVIRGHCHKRLFYSPQSVVNHLHWSKVPSTLGQSIKRQKVAVANDDAIIFAKHMRNEGIDILRVAKEVGFNVGNLTDDMRNAFEALRGI